jgi:hypothetical protein
MARQARRSPEDRHRAVVDELDLHVRAEDPARGAQALAEALVQRLGDLGRAPAT